MNRNQSKMKPTGKSSRSPASSIVKDSAAMRGQGMSPTPYGSGKALRSLPPQMTKTSGDGSGVSKIGRNFNKWPRRKGLNP